MSNNNLRTAVVKVIKNQHYGFLAPSDGTRDLFFHRTAVCSGLLPTRGTSVQFTVGRVNGKLCADRVCPFGDTSAHQQYSIWRVDRQDRPCLGTTECCTCRSKRRELEEGGFRERLSSIVADIGASGAPLTSGFAWYNQTNQRTEAFHLKFAMNPDVYQHEYRRGHGQQPRQLDVSSEQFAQRFREDYYGDKVLAIHQQAQECMAVQAGHVDSSVLRAADKDVCEVGPVLLYTRAPLRLSEITDQVMAAAEAAVVDAFSGLHTAKKPFWHSICLVPLCDGGIEEVQFLIGAKMDEPLFAKQLPGRQLQCQFLSSNQYANPDRGSGPSTTIR